MDKTTDTEINAGDTEAQPSEVAAPCDCSAFPTSPALEAIVGGFRIRICEVIERGFRDKRDRQLRVDFVAPSDVGTPMVCGASCVVFSADDSPRDFANSLRAMADNLDAYWARAFPGALPNVKDEARENRAGRTL